MAPAAIPSGHLKRQQAAQNYKKLYSNRADHRGHAVEIALEQY